MLQKSVGVALNIEGVVIQQDFLKMVSHPGWMMIMSSYQLMCSTRKERSNP